MTAAYDPLDYLTPAERAEVESLSEYLTHHGKTDFKNMHEKSIAEVLNKASPNSRFFINANRKVVTELEDSGGRYRPFQERITPVIDKDTQAVFDRTRTEEVIIGLNERMGTPTETDSGPPDLRETLTASFDTGTPND